MSISVYKYTYYIVLTAYAVCHATLSSTPVFPCYAIFFEDCCYTIEIPPCSVLNNSFRLDIALIIYGLIYFVLPFLWLKNPW